MRGFRFRFATDEVSAAVDARPELALCAGVATAVSLLLLLVPLGGDAAAHVYRTLLVQHGILVWDNLWFAGQYPLSTYSLLYYLPAALVGNEALGIMAVVLAAALFASLVLREWGSVARWPSRWFALLAGGQLFTGDYPYTLGFATLLATLWALQRRRTWLALAGAALTLGASPLAFLILCLALVALFLRKRRVDARVLVVGAAIVVLAGIQAGVLALFPSRGLYYPYGLWRLLAGLAVAALGTSLALRGRARATLASLFVVWALANVVSYLVPSPVGHNLLRPAAVVFPVMLLAALLARFRPLWLALPALAAALAANVVPYLTMIPARSTDASGKAAFWRPLLGYLAAHPAAGFRVEVVPTANHWEAYYLPRAGYALARGWYRQLDIGDNPALYRPLTPAGYRAWLRSTGVRYVLLTHLHPATSDAARETSLLTSGRSGLVPVFRSPAGSVYELPHASGVLTGPAPASIDELTHSVVRGSVAAPGDYLLRIHYTPYVRVGSGPVCVSPAPDGMSRLDASRPGTFTLRAIEDPEDVLATLLDGDPGRCPGAG